MFIFDDLIKQLIKSYVEGKYNEKRIAAKGFAELYHSFSLLRDDFVSLYRDLEENNIEEIEAVTFEDLFTIANRLKHLTDANDDFEKFVFLRRWALYQMEESTLVVGGLYLQVSKALEIYNNDLHRFILMEQGLKVWLAKKYICDCITDMEVILFELSEFIKEHFSVEDLFSR